MKHPWFVGAIAIAASSSALAADLLPLKNGIYVAVAFLWLIPDRRFERRLHHQDMQPT